MNEIIINTINVHSDEYISLRNAYLSMFYLNSFEMKTM